MLIWLGACAAPPDRYDVQRRAGDFLLRVTVEAWGDPSRDESAGLPTEPGQYVVTPDRELRVALGPGATADVYPGRTAVLRPEEMDELWRLTVQAWRSVENRAAGAKQGSRSGEMRVRVRFRGEGVSRSFKAPLDAEGVRALANRLISLRGGEPDPR